MVLKPAYPSVLFTLRKASHWIASPLPDRLFRRSASYDIARFLEESQWWSTDRLREHQDRQLKALVEHAYENVPYYRSVFKSRGLLPEDIATTADLEKLPFLTKDDLRAYGRELRARNISDADVIVKSTSGTTGHPVRVGVLRSLIHFDNDPYHWRHFSWAGCTNMDTRATLLASTLPPTSSGRRRLYSYSPLHRVLTLSTYDLKPQTIDRYAAALRSHSPVYLVAFPSAIERLVALLAQAKTTCPVRLKAVFTQSETLYPWQRDLVERYFSCPVFDWYAMEERVVCAGDCELHLGHHVVTEYGIVEFVRPSVASAGTASEIVATPLHNFAMPLIRYRTGDMAVPVDEPCPCGRGLPLMRLVGGRSRCFAVLDTGHLVSVTVVDIPKATPKVEQFQFVQDIPGVLTLNLVTNEDLDDRDLTAIRANLTEKFGSELIVNIQIVPEIRRTSRGKIPILVQRLDLSEYGGLMANTAR